MPDTDKKIIADELVTTPIDFTVTNHRSEFKEAYRCLSKRDEDIIMQCLATKCKYDDVCLTAVYDGVDIAITYVRGNCNSVITKGDGVQGENITSCAMRIVPKLKLQIDEHDTICLKATLFLERDKLKEVSDFLKSKDCTGFTNTSSSLVKELISLNAVGMPEVDIRISTGYDVFTDEGSMDYSESYDIFNKIFVETYTPCFSVPEAIEEIKKERATCTDNNIPIRGFTIKFGYVDFSTSKFPTHLVLTANNTFSGIFLPLIYPEETTQCITMNT